MAKKFGHRPSLPLITCLILFLLPALLLFGCRADLSFPTEYQTVFLDNGQAFIGKVEAGTNFLVLRDVFYVQRQVTSAAADKKQEVNVLLKRGSEWHAPDFMRINLSHIILIEPVAPDSRVAQLIREAKKPPAAAPREEKAPPAGK